MPGNSFGEVFRITTAGESHGPGNVVIIDGVPAGLDLSVDDIQPDLDRRRPGQSKVTTQRKEADAPEILSGVFEGKTTGTSLAILIRNEDQRSRDYADIKDKYRPGHADYTFDAKYGFRDYRGGGRSSARETNVRVAAGAVAKKLLHQLHGVRIVGYVKQIGRIAVDIPDPSTVTMEQVESNIVRCPNPAMAQQMIDLIKQVRADGDSVGGTIECVVRNAPVGLGEPVFDKLEAELAKAMLSLPATKGFEIGSGFAGTRQRGSEHNDAFYMEGSRVRTATNKSGGIQGGISNGEPILLRVAFKPVATIFKEQDTVNTAGEAVKLKPKMGRHDPCVLPRAVPMVEAMAALVLVDHALRHKAQCQ
jgi:chorismate synthase